MPYPLLNLKILQNLKNYYNVKILNQTLRCFGFGCCSTTSVKSRLSTIFVPDSKPFSYFATSCHFVRPMFLSIRHPMFWFCSQILTLHHFRSELQVFLFCIFATSCCFVRLSVVFVRIPNVIADLSGLRPKSCVGDREDF